MLSLSPNPLFFCFCFSPNSPPNSSTRHFSTPLSLSLSLKPKPKPKLNTSSSHSHTPTDNNALTDSSPTDFLRYNRHPHIPHVAGELQASIVKYKKMLPWRFINPPLQVDLVSAVHIADRRYFEILQKKLATYDCVLYEGVGDKDDSESESETEPEPAMQGYNITGFIQRLMGRILSMDFQLDCISYKAHNWYNADLDWDTFQRLQEERGETLLTAARDALGSALKFDQHSSSAQFGFDSFRSNLLRVSWIVPMPLAISLIINLTCSSDGRDEDNEQMDDFGHIVGELLELGFGSALKVILARSLTSVFASEIYTDLEENSVIIGERNKAALEQLKKAISRGEKRIAIFYGAGHMPDLGRRLRRDFKMVPTEVDWVTAWSIRRPKSKFLGPFFQKYMGRFFPFSKEMGRMMISGSVFCGILLLDLWLWWSAVSVAYWTGFHMLRFVQPFVIM
ncbi:thermosome subunit gamma [Rhynchospora pubera]|uniref:Thermosome subunit gamma n=1 Tax=Rhynchospora pubera TaxID=906938 RepID=A0AAV8FX83_9POAL|nr:thermosome subunit gamma [Rhynchospora pubera]